MSVLDTAELVTRALGLVLVAAAWVLAGWGAYVGSGFRPGPATGLATRHRAHLVYALGAVPYFVVCIVLWQPLPLEFGISARWALLMIGAAVGISGAAFYFGGRFALGRMYNVSSSYGSELYADHRLITAGPYRWCRHPMYLGLFLAAVGGLLVYRKWTLLFMLVSLLGAVLKARSEEALLAAEFGTAWNAYTRRVPAVIPRIRSKEVNDVHPTPAT